MSTELKPDFTPPELLETIRKIRFALWNYQDEHDPKYLEEIEELCNNAIDPNFEESNS